MRRTEVVNHTATEAIHYVYDGLLPVQELDETLAVVRQLTRGLDLTDTLAEGGGTGGLLALSLPEASQADGWESYYYLYDGGGNVTGLISAEAVSVRGVAVDDSVAEYVYSPFGQLLSDASTNLIDQPWQFSSQEAHAASGLVLYLYRAYDAEWGRWLNRDPLGEQGGNNLYTFVFNQPVNAYDPDGQVAHFVAGAAIGFGLDAAVQLTSGQPYNWKQGASAAAFGAIGVGVFGKLANLGYGLAGRTAMTLIADGALGAAEQMMNNLLNGCPLMQGTSRAAAYSAGLGLAGGVLARPISAVFRGTVAKLPNLEHLEKGEADLRGDKFSADWKLAIAVKLKRESAVSNRWLSEALQMGAPNAVSNNCGRYQREREAACPWAKRLKIWIMSIDPFFA